MCYLQSLSLLSSMRHTQPGAVCVPVAPHRAWFSICGLLDSTDSCKADRISCGHLHISFQNAHLFPLDHATASAYLHGCVQCREISYWRLGQRSICNTRSFKVKKGLNTYLLRVHFEEYWIDNHLRVSGWHDEPIDRIGLLWPPVSSSKGQSEVLQVTRILCFTGQGLLTYQGLL